MRGTRALDVNLDNISGIIPAYAGNTHFIVIIAVARRDHPRVCGEHRIQRNLQKQRKGSSPRMRGTPWRGYASGNPSGIIPAYAGNTARNGESAQA